MSKLWFKRKKRGLGYVPTSTAGWVVTGVYAFFLVSWFFGLAPIGRSPWNVILEYIPKFLFLTAVYGAIVYYKGPRNNQ
jgi:hypothetical protein